MTTLSTSFRACRGRADVTFFLALGALLSGCSADESDRVEEPNLVLISVDTLRADYLGCYGHPRDVSPTMDSVAQAGTRFEDVTAASPWTLPSHATMLSGLYPSRHGVIDHQFALTAPTLATLLQGAGYNTLAVVNTKNVGEPRFGLMRGFDRQKYEYEVPVIRRPNGEMALGKIIINTGSNVAARAVQFLEGRDADRPFFLFMHFYDVHTDFTPDPHWKDELVGDYGGVLDGSTMQLLRARFRGDPALGADDMRWLKEMYEAEIRTFDEVLAGFLSKLDGLGLTESTIVAITSDHGEEYLEHGGVLHGRTYYEELVRIPLILSGPGVPVGAVVDMPAHLIDVAPTLLSLVGVEHGRMDGIDLSIRWRDPSNEPAPRFLFAEADHNNVVNGKDRSNIRRMVRLGDYKLHFDTVSGVRELYNIASDPGELQELSASEPEKLELLWGELQRFMLGETQGLDQGPLDEETLELMRTLGYAGDGE